MITLGMIVQDSSLIGLIGKTLVSRVGTCPCCNKAIERFDQVERKNGQLVHASCYDAAFSAAIGERGGI
jgi:hypothetical protein